MANKYLFMVHKPTGKRFYLGKRMARNWYVSPHYKDEGAKDIYDSLNDFYMDCYDGTPATLDHPINDDFELVQEY